MKYVSQLYFSTLVKKMFNTEVLNENKNKQIQSLLLNAHLKLYRFYYYTNGYIDTQ